ncbi:MAG: hypothetical protein LQ346_007513 [Caloplaca aetnensis]|nr:MAG: hypothetical protein LQ346_007513 [Caloplaca aetnensis]
MKVNCICIGNPPPHRKYFAVYLHRVYMFDNNNNNNNNNNNMSFIPFIRLLIIYFSIFRALASSYEGFLEYPSVKCTKIVYDSALVTECRSALEQVRKDGSPVVTEAGQLLSWASGMWHMAQSIITPVKMPPKLINTIFPGHCEISLGNTAKPDHPKSSMMLVNDTEITDYATVSTRRSLPGITWGQVYTGIEDALNSCAKDDRTGATVFVHRTWHASDLPHQYQFGPFAYREQLD